MTRDLSFHTGAQHTTNERIIF